MQRARNNIALRAGVVVEARDRLFECSPFALNGLCHRLHLDSIASASHPMAAVNAAVVLNASMPTAPTSKAAKAARWAARVAGKAEGPSEQASMPQPAQPPESTPPPSAVAGDGLAAAGGKAARWAARVAGKAEGPSEQASMPQPAQPPSAVAGDSGIQHGAGATTEAAKSERQFSYKSFSTSALMYSGWMLDGKPHGNGRLKMADGTEYHGELQNGIQHGSGDYYFSDTSKLSIKFRNGCPEGKGRLVDSGGQHWDVEYNGACPLHEGAEPFSKVEAYPAAVEEATIDFMAISTLTSSETGSTIEAIVPKNNRVVGKLVMARPLLGDIPLWNREECRNAIVLIGGGPVGDPHYKVSCALKIHHAQMAGAKAVIIINTASKFFDGKNPPFVKHGPVDCGIKPNPPDLAIKIRVPAVMILEEKAHLLREKATHMLIYLDPERIAGLPQGVRVGYVHIPKQESKVGMEKTKAQNLMEEFFAERRKERSEEVNMLLDVKSSGKDQVDETLKSREFVGGSFFESMNPFKETKGAENLDSTLKDGIMRKISKMPGVEDLKKRVTEKMQGLRQDLELVLPVTVSWHESDENETSVPAEQEQSTYAYNMASLKKVTGFQMPTILPKDPAGNFVWCAAGQPPFWLRIRASETTTPLRLFFMGWEHVHDKKLSIQMSSVIDGKVANEGSQVFELVGGSENCEKFTGTKITVLISVNASGYHVTMCNQKILKDQIWFLPHHVSLKSVSMDKLSTLPLEPFNRHPRQTSPSYKLPKVWRLPPSEGVFKQPPKPPFQWNLEDWRLIFRHTAIGISVSPCLFRPPQ